MSDGNDFYPLVRLRHWDSPPQPPEGTWDESPTFTVQFPTGTISVRHLLGGSTGDSIPVPTGPYEIKAYRRGNPSKSHTGDMPTRPPADVTEEWTVDFWPAGR
ncbi:hypothetical protein [Streptomyces sp. NPDC008317]|uniref:hypothetical protein n=1 Tax=Streptomyces sp. NPDC008317 TaxID=3364827 RepID=UPI0036E77D9F